MSDEVTATMRLPPPTAPSGFETTASTDMPRRVAARALADAAAVFVAGWLVTALVRVALAPQLYDVPAYLAVLSGIAAVAGAHALPAVRRSEPLLVRVTVAGLLVMAAAIAAFDLQAPQPLYAPNPAIALEGAAALVAGLVLPFRFGAIAALALGLWHGWWELGPVTEATVGGYVSSVVNAATYYAGGLLVAGALGRSARQVGQSVSRLLADQRADRLRRARESSRVAAQTDVHDTVLTTLSGIGAGWLGRADPALLQAELRRDEHVLDDLRPGEDAGSVDLRSALNELATGSPFPSVAVRVEASAPVEVDSVVADAMVLATREALVNVVKHAGVDTATIRVVQGPGEVTVSICDDGTGFVPDAASMGLGIPGLAVRMAEVGGRAEVCAAPGRGTTVTLVRPQRPAGAMPPLWSVHGPRRGAVGLTAVAAVATLLSFANQAAGYDRLLPQVAALVLVLAGDAVTIATVIRQRCMPGWLSASLMARTAIVLLLSGLPLTGCAPMGWAHFTAPGQVIPCVVIVLLRPTWEAVAAVAVYAVGLGILAAPLYASGEACSITALNQTGIALNCVLAGVLFSRALRRHAGIAADVLAAQEELTSARAARHVRAFERRRLLPVVRAIVAETIGGLAEGRLDPADPVVREQCRRDARLVRSFLTQASNSDDLVTELFIRSVNARNAGVDVVVRGTLPRATVDPVHRQSVLACLDDCLRFVMSQGWTGQGWVTVLRTEESVLVTVVLADLPAHVTADDCRRALLRHATPGLVLDRSELVEGDLWVTCRVPARAQERLLLEEEW